MKKLVYFNEFNLPMDKTVYLPLVSGILQAYAQTFPELNSAFEFMPFLFIRDTPERILAKYDNPSVAAFSVCIWNHQLSLAVAKAVKEKFPTCQIVFGGPQVLANDKEMYPFIDHIILEEGEKKFVKWLGGLVGAEIKCDHHTLDDFPSPYTAGLFDQTIKDYPGITFQAIVEFVRGCPYSCSFCAAEGSIVITSTEKIRSAHGVPIQDISPGDLVLGFKENPFDTVWNRVESLACLGVKPVLRISTDDSCIEVTPDHKIYSSRGWKMASDLAIGDSVLLEQNVLKCRNPETGDVGPNLPWVKIKNIESAGEKRVYDLVNCSPSHNFFANGILISNCYWGQGFEEKKVRRHNLDYVRAEVEWIGRNQVKYAFCVAEDSMVSTIDGLVPIQNVTSEDRVWGWDEDARRVVLNQVGRVCCTGVKPVLRIEHGNGYVEATGDHRILTRRGWIEAGEIIPGDEVLSRLREAAVKIEPEVLLQNLLLQSGGTEEQVGWNSTGKERGKISPRGEVLCRLRETDAKIEPKVLLSKLLLQPGRAEGQKPGYRQKQRAGQEGGRHEGEEWKRSEQAGRNPAGKERGKIYRNREDCSRQKDCQWDGGRAGEEDQSGSSGQAQRMVQGRQELDEAYKFGNEKAKRSYGEGFGNAASTRLPLAEGGQASTLGVGGLAGEHEKVLERPRMVCQTFFESRGASKQIRERVNQLLRGEESAVSVYGRPDLVAGALPIGRLQEPRFHSQGEGGQEGDTRSRTILAPRFRGGTGGDKGLQECRLGSIFDLGRRCVGSGNGEQDLPVFWVTVTSVKAAGEKRVYDLINAVPSHNFFANGILVSNCADANFGMFDRDQDVARIYVEAKQKYSYPEKLRVCYGKNREEAVYKTAKILSAAGLAKAITLARQSNDAQVLENIERANIKLSVYSGLQERYHRDGIPTYTEIILGLPGETVATFHKGIGEIMGSATQLFIYHCSILPNTEMAKPEYIAKHGIKTVRVPLAEIHCAIRKPEHVVEYEDIIIQTNTMSQAEWVKCCVYAWEMQLKQSFNTDVTPEERERFFDIAHDITRGASRGQVDLRFGNIYWEPEEISYARIMLQRGEISGDLRDWARETILFGRKSNAHQPPLGPPA